MSIIIIGPEAAARIRGVEGVSVYVAKPLINLSPEGAERGYQEDDTLMVYGGADPQPVYETGPEQALEQAFAYWQPTANSRMASWATLRHGDGILLDKRVFAIDVDGDHVSFKRLTAANVVAEQDTTPEQLRIVMALCEKR